MLDDDAQRVSSKDLARVRREVQSSGVAKEFTERGIEPQRLASSVHESLARMHPSPLLKRTEKWLFLEEAIFYITKITDIDDAKKLEILKTFVEAFNSPPTVDSWPVGASDQEDGDEDEGDDEGEDEGEDSSENEDVQEEGAVFSQSRSHRRRSRGVGKHTGTADLGKKNRHLAHSRSKRVWKTLYHLNAPGREIVPDSQLSQSTQADALDFGDAPQPGIPALIPTSRFDSLDNILSPSRPQLTTIYSSDRLQSNHCVFCLQNFQGCPRKRWNFTTRFLTPY
jgi:hypothetical protein